MQRRHFHQAAGGEAQPFFAEAKHQQRTGLHLALDLNGHCAAVFLLQRVTVEQTRCGRRIHRAIAAMDVFDQQRAGLVAMDTDTVPAIIDGLGIFMGDAQGSRRRSSFTLTVCGALAAGGAVLQSSGSGRVALGLQQGGQVHQRVGMLRFEVQRLAIKTLGFEDTAGDIAEQSQPIEHLGHRFVAGANNCSQAARASALLPSLASAAMFASSAAASKLVGLSGCDACGTTLANRPTASVPARIRAHRLRHRQRRRDECRQRFGLWSAMTTEGKGLRDTNRAHAQTPQQTAFGRADKQHAVDMGQALEHFENLLLGRLVEIDQQIAAEHEVIGRLTGQQGRIQQIADLQAHLFEHPSAEAIAVVLGA